MFQDQYPLLTPHTPLRQEKLKSLRDFPRNWTTLQHQGYSDGILYGCTVTVEEGCLHISPGILKYGERFYMMNNVTSLPYGHNEAWQVLKIRFLNMTEDHDFERYFTEIWLDGNTEIQANEMELCRFKLKPGAELRQNYQDFADMGTEFDTLNILHVPFAGKGRPTLSPTILERFATEAMQYHLNEPLDFPFCMLCLQGETVMADTIAAYVAQRLRCEWKEYENAELCDLLCKVMQRIRDGGLNIRRAQERDRRIMVE